MLTKQEVANLLRVSLGTVNNLMRRGELPYIKVGGSVRFKEDDIRRIENGGTSPKEE